MTGIAFPPVDEPLEVTWARFGDIIEPPGLAGRPEPYFVLHACDHATKAFFCVTHRTHIANQGNLAMHLEHGGRHHLAAWCSTDRVYQEPNPSIRDAADPAQAELL